MTMISVPYQSLEDLFFPVRVTGLDRDGIEALQANVAFMPAGTAPGVVDFIYGPEWWDDPAAPADVATLRLRVGPLNDQLFEPAAGQHYDVWLQLADLIGGDLAPIIYLGVLRCGLEGTYSGNPTTSTRDAARFLCGDTGPVFELGDAEVDWLVSQYGSARPYTVAAAACDAIATRWSREWEQVSEGDVSRQGNRAAAMRAQAKALREHAVNIEATGAPVEAGLADVCGYERDGWARLGVHDNLGW